MLSIPGKGTEVIVRIPLADESPAPTTQEVAEHGR
jgi:hypothetical protein